MQVCAQLSIVPLIRVVLVEKSLIFLQTLFGVDLVTKCENYAQVLKLTLSYSILENCHAVGVCSTRSDALFKNEHG